MTDPIDSSFHMTDSSHSNASFISCFLSPIILRSICDFHLPNLCEPKYQIWWLYNFLRNIINISQKVFANLRGCPWCWWRSLISVKIYSWPATTSDVNSKSSPHTITTNYTTQSLNEAEKKWYIVLRTNLLWKLLIWISLLWILKCFRFIATCETMISGHKPLKLSFFTLK